MKRLIVVVTTLAIAFASGPSPRAAAQETEAAGAPEEDSVPIGPFVVMGAGALVLGGGSIVFFLGASDRARVEEAVPGTSFRDVRDAYDRAPAMLTVGQIMIGAGLVFVGAGLGWLILRLAGVRDDGTTTTRLDVGPFGLVLSGAL